MLEAIICTFLFFPPSSSVNSVHKSSKMYRHSFLPFPDSTLLLDSHPLRRRPFSSEVDSSYFLFNLQFQPHPYRIFILHWSFAIFNPPLRTGSYLSVFSSDLFFQLENELLNFATIYSCVYFRPLLFTPSSA